jgi:hypothetical protein
VAALALLVRDAGPVLEDFPEDAPHTDLGEAPADIVCPVSFPRMAATGDLVERLDDEVAQLAAWHELASRHRSRTTLGVTGLTIGEIVRFLGTWITAAPQATYRSGVAPQEALKRACDELKAFYYEAKSVQPGRHTPAAIQDWFWRETSAGEALLAVRDRAAASADPAVKALAGQSLVPRAVDAVLQGAGRK